jgi:hypothetical protein
MTRLCPYRTRDFSHAAHSPTNARHREWPFTSPGSVYMTCLWAEYAGHLAISTRHPTPARLLLCQLVSCENALAALLTSSDEVLVKQAKIRTEVAFGSVRQMTSSLLTLARRSIVSRFTIRGTGEKELLAPLLGSKNPLDEPESCVFKPHPRRTHIDNFGR